MNKEEIGVLIKEKVYELGEKFSEAWEWIVELSVHVIGG